MITRHIPLLGVEFVSVALLSGLFALPLAGSMMRYAFVQIILSCACRALIAGEAYVEDEESEDE